MLARGPRADPDGTKVVSFFNTGHHASFNKLGGDDVLIATVCNGIGTLVRWGKNVVDAINRAFPPKQAHEVEVRSAYLQFDMATGSLLALPGAATPEQRSNFIISLAAFGIQQLGFETADMGFPMEDVTQAKLFSLFGDLGVTKTGTIVYTTSRVVTPDANGTQIMAGDVLLEEHLSNRWWLPPSSQLPWTLDVPRGGSVSKRPFEVTLVCGGVSRTVDWFANGWESVVKAGAASLPMELLHHGKDGKAYKLHYQIGWLDVNDDAQAKLSGKIMLYRHARYTCTVALPSKGGSVEAGDMHSCMELMKTMESGGPKGFGRVYDLLSPVYGDGWPLNKEQTKGQSKIMMRTLLGDNMAMLVSCHAFEWQEGKEHFSCNDVFPSCLPKLYAAAAKYAHEHPGHPLVVKELEVMKAKKQAAADAAALRAAKRASTPRSPAAAAVKEDAEAAVASPAGAARVRKTVKMYEPSNVTPKKSSSTKKSSGGGAAGGAAGGKRGLGVFVELSDAPVQAALKKVKTLVGEATADWRKLTAAAPRAVPKDVGEFVGKLLCSLDGALKTAL